MAPQRTPYDPLTGPVFDGSQESYDAIRDWIMQTLEAMPMPEREIATQRIRQQVAEILAWLRPPTVTVEPPESGLGPTDAPELPSGSF